MPNTGSRSRQGRRVKRALFASGRKRGHNSKGKVLDIATKVRYLEAYERLSNDPAVPPAEKAMLANKGDYPGLYQGALGKWQKLAQEQKLGTDAEALAPKWRAARGKLRGGCSAKWRWPGEGSGRKPGKLPLPVMEVAEGILLKQLELGAEITVPAVAQLLGSAVEVWNEEVGHLQKQRAEAEAALEQRRQELVEGGRQKGALGGSARRADGSAPSNTRDMQGRHIPEL